MKQQDIKLVILESPFAGKNPDGSHSENATQANMQYARECAKHCALLGEATQASHLHYTQFLRDLVPEERALGIALGLAWTRVAHYQVFYTDRGWSRGMIAALKAAITEGRNFKIRSIYISPTLPEGSWSEQEIEKLLSAVQITEPRI